MFVNNGVILTGPFTGFLGVILTLEYQIVPSVDLHVPSVAWPCHPLSENVPWVDVNVPFVDVCLALKLHSHKKS